MCDAAVLLNLNGIKRHSPYGIYKKSLAKDKDSAHLICDYMEKISNSLQDIEKESQKKTDVSVLISSIAFLSWIDDSVDSIEKSYKSFALAGFNYAKTQIRKNSEYLKAIRSFVFAHPYKTDRHGKFGFDGSLRCADIRPACSDITEPFWHNDDKFYIDANGKTDYTGQEVDYWLYVYNSNKYDNTLKQYIGISLKPLYKIANDYVTYLYALDKHLCKVKTRSVSSTND